MNETRRTNGARKAEPPAPSNNGQPKPWRTEGLPNHDEDPVDHRPRPRWWLMLIYLGLGYLLVFGMLSFQDSLGEPTKVPYTEFTAQVEQHNVAEVFSQGDTIEGTLREPKPIPDQDDTNKTYEQFTTERPTFAQDDLFTQLKAGGATVSATPLTQDRGILWNLLISFAPILLCWSASGSGCSGAPARWVAVRGCSA